VSYFGTNFRLLIMNPCEHASLHVISSDIGDNAGECPTLEKVFKEHFARLVSILARLTGDWGRAEELAAEAFLKLSKRPSLLRPNGNLAGWLYRTAMNLALDTIRAESRRKRKEQTANAVAISDRQKADALDEILLVEKRKQVRSVLCVLKPVQAQLLLLRNSGMTYKELSRFLRLNLGSIGTLLARAESEFEKKYRARYGGEK
jgi:RNA polymerase sigma factor (sigma-70 family)